MNNLPEHDRLNSLPESGDDDNFSFATFEISDVAARARHNLGVLARKAMAQQAMAKDKKRRSASNATGDDESQVVIRRRVEDIDMEVSEHSGCDLSDS